MFLGQFDVKFTGSGRVVLPKKIREEIQGTSVILSRGFENCIWGFSEEGFEIEAKKQLEVSSVDEKAREMRRYFFSGSEKVELDNQGRFVIPGNLLKFAAIKIQVVIVGAGDHFEIWDQVGWIAYMKQIEEGYGRLS